MDFVRYDLKAVLIQSRLECHGLERDRPIKETIASDPCFLANARATDAPIPLEPPLMRTRIALSQL